jgi:hypothetical protein
MPLNVSTILLAFVISNSFIPVSVSSRSRRTPITLDSGAFPALSPSEEQGNDQ